MAQKITGLTLDVGPNLPLLDVDTAIVHLLEDLQRAGRTNEMQAVQALVQEARKSTMPWNIYEAWPEGENVIAREYARDIKSIDTVTRVIVLEPMSDCEEKSDGRT
jgi:hypothetical protein